MELVELGGGDPPQAGHLVLRSAHGARLISAAKAQASGWSLARYSSAEGGRLPDLIVELLSPSTERIDRKTKMALYAQVFRTRDYFLFDYDKEALEGYRLAGNAYEPITPDRQGRLRSAVLGLDLGLWKGGVRALESGETEESTWVRLFDPAGRLIPTLGEAAEARAAAQSARADTAEAELKRLRSLLGGLAG